MTPPTILIVDDEPDLLASIEFVLGGQGFRTVTAATGTAALAAANSDPSPSLILLDVWLPDIGGVEVSRRLSDRAKTRSIPIIFVSATDRDALRRQGLALENREYLGKPFSLGELLEKVRRTLEG